MESYNNNLQILNEILKVSEYRSNYISAIFKINESRIKLSKKIILILCFNRGNEYDILFHSFLDITELAINLLKLKETFNSSTTSNYRAMMNQIKSLDASTKLFQVIIRGNLNSEYNFSLATYDDNKLKDWISYILSRIKTYEKITKVTKIFRDAFLTLIENLKKIE